jgi:hypothetical protein
MPPSLPPKATPAKPGLMKGARQGKDRRRDQETRASPGTCTAVGLRSFESSLRFDLIHAVHPVHEQWEETQFTHTVHERCRFGSQNACFSLAVGQQGFTVYGNIYEVHNGSQGIGLPGSCHLGRGNHCGPSQAGTVKDWVTPQDLKQMQSYLGLCNSYRIFVRNYSTIASPLSSLTKKAIPFKWGESQDKAFTELRDRLMTAPILKSGDMSQPFAIQADGSVL